MKRMIVNEREKAHRLISAYPQDIIDHVNRCREDIAGLEVYEFHGDDMVEADPTAEINDIKKSYIYPALHEGAFETVEEFNDLFDALEIVDPLVTR